MKLGIASLVVATVCVSGTSAFSAGYLSSLGGANGAAPAAASAPKKNYSPTAWKPTGAKRNAPNPEAAVLETTIAQAPAVPAPAAPETTSSTIDLTNFLRREYEAWLAHHGKTADENRFKIFKDNYIRQWQTDRVTGEYHFLNEYGDMTPEEFAQMTGVTLPQAPAAPVPPAPQQVQAPPAPVLTTPPPQPAAPRTFGIKKATPLQASFAGAYSSVSKGTNKFANMESTKAINKETVWESVPDDLDGKFKDYPVFKLN